MFCPKCGTDNKENNFCASCGNQLNNSTQSQNPQQYTPHQYQQNNNMFQPSAQNTYQHYNSQSLVRRKNKTVIIVSIIIAIIIAITTPIIIVNACDFENEPPPPQVFINNDYLHWVLNPPTQESNPQTFRASWRVAVRGTIYNQTNTSFEPMRIRINLYRDIRATSRIGSITFEQNVSANSQVEFTRTIWLDLLPSNPGQSFPEIFSTTILN